jgi:hypothetical protein
MTWIFDEIVWNTPANLNVRIIRSLILRVEGSRELLHKLTQRQQVNVWDLGLGLAVMTWIFDEITWSILVILGVRIIRNLILGVDRSQELFRRRAQRQQVNVRDLGLDLKRKYIL